MAGGCRSMAGDMKKRDKSSKKHVGSEQTIPDAYYRHSLEAPTTEYYSKSTNTLSSTPLLKVLLLSPPPHRIRRCFGGNEPKIPHA
eukprot:scaffold5092_cov61-Cylindrotheca_fusiformis.AAC.2